MMKLMLVMLALVVTGCAGCRTDRPPEHKMIEMAFFKCEKCRSLEGGIYGKGPFKSLHSLEAKACVHDWRLLDMVEFKNLAMEWKGVDWTKEIPFWNPETIRIPNQPSEETR